MIENLTNPIALQPVNVIHIIYLTIGLFGLIVIGNNPRISSLRVLLLLVVLLLIFNVAEETGFSRDLHLVSPIFTLGFGPAFYWFCRQLVYGTAPDIRPILLHFSPMIIALPFTHWPQAVIALGSLSQLIYLSLSLYLVSRYHRVTAQTCSNAQDLSIHWITRIIAVFLFMMLQDLVRLNLQPFAPIKGLQLWYFLNTCIYAGLVAYLIVMALRQPQLFNLFSQFEFLAEESKPVKSAPDQDAISLFQELDSIIRKRELYRQPRFSLRDLATETGIQEKTLSWAINQGAQNNFSEYINHLRIEAACTYLYSDHTGPLLDLAYKVGFNSKTTFNAAFKKQTGLTPSQFGKKRAAD